MTTPPASDAFPEWVGYLRGSGKLTREDRDDLANMLVDLKAQLTRARREAENWKLTAEGYVASVAALEAELDEISGVPRP